MRFVTYVLLAGFVLFSGYWALVAHLGQSQATAIVDRAPGLSGRPGPVRGYPLEFRTEIQAPQWRSTAGSAGWQTEAVTLSVPSLRPANAALRFPRQHQIEIAGQAHMLETQDMCAAITARTDLTLGVAELNLASAYLDPAIGLNALGAVSAELQHKTGQQYIFTLDARDMVLSPQTHALIDPTQSLPAIVSGLQISAEPRFSAALDLRRPLPALTEVALESLRLVWGDVELGLQGHVTRDAAGRLDGALKLSLSDWQVLHQWLRSSGMLSDDAAMMAGMLLASQAEPGSTAISLGLDVSASTLSLGPFALLQLPPL